MAQPSNRRPVRPPYDNPFFRLFLAARSRTTRASHRAAIAGNRPAYAGACTCLFSPRIRTAHAPSPSEEEGAEFLFRQSRRL